MIQGKNPRVLARELKKQFDVSTHNAERLMRTELARVQTEAQKQSFERNGFEQYTFLANSKCCDICQALNGKHFKVADMMPGENAAPLHPHCRCSAAAYEDSEDYEAWLNFLSNGGSTEEWNRATAVERNLMLLTKSPKRSNLIPNIQLFAKKSKDFPTVILPKQEYAHLMSEIATNLTKEQSSKKVFSKCVGDYIYTIENHGFGDYRVIKKIKIEEDL